MAQTSSGPDFPVQALAQNVHWFTNDGPVRIAEMPWSAREAILDEIEQQPEWLIEDVLLRVASIESVLGHESFAIGMLRDTAAEVGPGWLAETPLVRALRGF